jgi:hypothetical protein
MTASLSKSLFSALTFDAPDGVSPDQAYANAYYLQQILNFSDVIKSQGLEAAIDQHLAAILQRDAVESVVSQGGIAQLLTHKATPVLDLQGNTVAIKVNISDGANLYLDPLSKDITGRDYGNVQERGSYGYDPKTGEFKLLNGNIYYNFGDDGFVLVKVANGVRSEADVVSYNEDFRYRLTARDPEVGMILDQYHFDAVVTDNDTGLQVTYQNGQAVKIQQLSPKQPQTVSIDNPATIAQKRDAYLQQVQGMANGALRYNTLTTAFESSYKNNGVNFGADVNTFSSPTPALTVTPYGTFEDSLKTFNVITEGDERVIQNLNGSSTIISGEFQSYSGWDSGTLLIQNQKLVNAFGFQVNSVGYNQFKDDSDPTFVANNSFQTLMSKFSYVNEGGIITQCNIDSTHSMIIQSFNSTDGSMVTRGILLDKTDNTNIKKYEFETKFTGESLDDIDPEQIQDGVILDRMTAMVALQKLLNGQKTVPTSGDMDAMKAFYSELISKTLQGASVSNPSFSIDGLSQAMAAATPVASWNLNHEMQSSILNTLVATAGNTIIPGGGTFLTLDYLQNLLKSIYIQPVISP